MRTISIKSTKPQADFHALTCKHPAFVAGFGSGKSETMTNQAFMDASHSASALIGIYEPTYDLVSLIAVPRMEEKLIDYGIRYKYNKQRNTISTSNSQIGDFIFRTLDNPARIVGYETYRAHVDELDTLNEAKAREAWNKIIARNREKPNHIDLIHKVWNEKFQRMSVYNRVSAYCTPEGFGFMYKTWGKNPKPGYEMIQASSRSNPFLPDDYIETLENSYPKNLITAYIEGKFVNLTSGGVYTNYDRKLNGTSRRVEKGDALHIGMDFNVGKMSAIVHVEDYCEILEEDIVSAVDEFLGILDTPAMIKAIQDKYPDHHITIYPDASGRNRKSSDASVTDISQLKLAFDKVKNKTKNPFVKNRVASVQGLLCNAKDVRRYYVNEDACPGTADSLEQQVYNANGDPDKTKDNDHPNDALGYYIHNKHPIVVGSSIQTLDIRGF